MCAANVCLCGFPFSCALRMRCVCVCTEYRGACAGGRGACYWPACVCFFVVHMHSHTAGREFLRFCCQWCCSLYNVCAQYALLRSFWFSLCYMHGVCICKMCLSLHVVLFLLLFFCRTHSMCMCAQGVGLFRKRRKHGVFGLRRHRNTGRSHTCHNKRPDLRFVTHTTTCVCVRGAYDNGQCVFLLELLKAHVRVAPIFTVSLLLCLFRTHVVCVRGMCWSLSARGFLIYVTQVACGVVCVRLRGVCSFLFCCCDTCMRCVYIGRGHVLVSTKFFFVVLAHCTAGVRAAFI